MSNITIQFRQAVEKASVLKNPTPKRNLQERKKATERDLFTQEAYRIYQHIASLKRFLLCIRPVYLSTGKWRGQVDMGSDALFQLPTNIHQLTDRDRDEIDFQAKLIIKQSIERIQELEMSQTFKKREEGWAQWLHSVLPLAEDVTLVHRSSMTWLLNQQLTKVSKIQKEQQEIRLTREIEKSENQLSRMPVSSIIPTQEESIELDAFEEMLSKEQLQVLDKENSVMLENLNNTLNQIKSAEKALLEISTLQTQLTNHLAAQTLQTDQLYADALATTKTVERGNTQLLSAKERNRGSRRFMLAFLIGASFVLLFLDWYS